MVLLACRVEDVEKLEKSPLIAKDIPIYGVIYHTEVRNPMELTFRQRSRIQSYTCAAHLPWLWWVFRQVS
jgi:hypothetical protein